mgnify:FL=1
MRKIAVIYISRKRNAVPLKQRLASFRNARNKKAIILIALMIPLIFLVVLLFSKMEG